MQDLTAVEDTAADGAPPPPPLAGSTRPTRGFLSVVGVSVVVAAALVGGNVFGLRDRLSGSSVPPARPVALGRGQGSTQEPSAPAQQSVLRSYPWWQSVTTFEGDGPTGQAAFNVDPGALQWRLTWTCNTGQLTVRAVSARSSLVDASCPGTGKAYASTTGPISLAVATGGSWHLQVEQQVDVPLVEPPTATMTSPGTTVAASGTLYGIDQSGSGKVTFYHGVDGAFSLRMDGYFVTPNVDLEIRLSPIAEPHSTAQYLASPSVEVAPLDVTTGSVNFAVPAGVDPRQYRSVVIWCPTITSAYAAATLNGS